MLRAIESLDAGAYTDLMAEEVEIRLPDGSIPRGRNRVNATFTTTWASFAELTHHELNLFGSADHVVHEAFVESSAHDGTQYTATVTSWVERGQDGPITSARVYA